MLARFHLPPFCPCILDHRRSRPGRKTDEVRTYGTEDGGLRGVSRVVLTGIVARRQGYGNGALGLVGQPNSSVILPYVCSVRHYSPHLHSFALPQTDACRHGEASASKARLTGERLPLRFVDGVRVVRTLRTSVRMWMPAVNRLLPWPLKDKYRAPYERASSFLSSFLAIQSSSSFQRRHHGAKARGSARKREAKGD